MFPLDSGIKRESIKGNVKVSGLLKEMVVFLLEWGVVKECFQGKRHFLLNHIETERQVEIWVERSFFLRFIYLFLVLLGLHCCAQAFSRCGSQELLFVVVHELIAVFLLLQNTGCRGIGFSSRSTGTQ